MTMQHLEVLRASIATATEAALTAVSTGGDRIKSLPNPRLLAFNAFSADCQYGALHSPEAFPGAPDPAVRVVGDVKAAFLLHHLREFPPMPMIPSSTVVVEGYQDSGGAQVVDACLEEVFEVGRSIDPKNPPSGRLRVARIASSGNMTASAWTSFGTGVNCFTGQPGKVYAVLGIAGIGANAIAIRLVHPDFMGLTPGKRATSDVALGYAEFLQFAPCFSGDTLLEIQGLDSAAEAMTATLYLWEMDG